MTSFSKRQELDYVVDRFTVLVCIIVLAAEPPGVLQALFLLFAKVAVLTHQARSDLRSMPQRKIEHKDPVTRERIVVFEDVQITSKEVRRKFLDGDVFVLSLQVVTMVLLTLGLVEILPAPLSAVLCIIVTSATMISMNARTFGAEFERMVTDARNSYLAWKAWILMEFYRFQEFVVYLKLPFTDRYLFPFLQGTNLSQVLQAHTIDVAVPEMGCIFIGEPFLDQSMTRQEQLQHEIRKELAYYVTPKKLNPNYISVRSLPRYEQDIKTSLTLSLSIAQMSMRKKIPTLAGTVQVVNHAGTKICNRNNDSYLTLFKPADWDESQSEDPEQIQALLMISNNLDLHL